MIKVEKNKLKLIIIYLYIKRFFNEIFSLKKNYEINSIIKYLKIKLLS